MRSLMEPPGFMYSSFTSTAASSGEVIFARRTRGVRPMGERTCSWWDMRAPGEDPLYTGRYRRADSGVSTRGSVRRGGDGPHQGEGMKGTTEGRVRGAVARAT